MSGDQFGQLTYLIVLGAAVAGYFVAQFRRSVSTVVQQGAIWTFIFIGVIAAHGLWSDLRTTVRPQQMAVEHAGRIEVPRAPDGYFYLTLDVEGTPLRFVIDTGASDIVLTREDAALLGREAHHLRYYSSANTANGTVPIAPIRLSEVRLGDMADFNVRATVNGGELFHSLLGMSYLGRFEKLEISRDRLSLIR